MRRNVSSDNELEDFTEYRQFLVEYQGILDKRLKIDEGYFLTQINNEYAILFVRKDLLPNDYDTEYITNFLLTKTEQLKSLKLSILSGPLIYTLLEVDEAYNEEAPYVHNQFPNNLKGEGVVVGIIDTGIDYLNERFLDENGNTRILEIWDQTITDEKNTRNTVPFGAIYNSEQIQSAINGYNKGNDPYEIVPTKDTNGHGTNMAGIIAANEKNNLFRGIAPKCKLVLVKLSEVTSFRKDHVIRIPIYNVTSIISGIEFLKNYAVINMKPMVIFMPVAATTSNHKGMGMLDGYLQKISSNIGIVMVTGTGDEGGNDGHASGTILKNGESKTINLLVDPKQKFLFFNIWVNLPNILSINIYSPSGEDTGRITPSINSKREHKFIFEKTTLYIKYSIPEQLAGEECISAFFDNLKPGIWRIKLTLSIGDNVEFHAWLPQKGITEEETRFSPSDPYGTITIPADSPSVISVAGYNQNNGNILEYSGLALRNQPENVIDVTAGANNYLTIGLNNTMVTISGTSVSSAIVSGFCALLLEWGVIKKHYPYMYTESVRTFLTRGTIQQKGDIYPNVRWGYGIIDLYKLFQSIT